MQKEDILYSLQRMVESKQQDIFRLHVDKTALEKYVLELQTQVERKDHLIATQQRELLQHTIKFTWRRGCIMPYWMTGYVQSVVVQRKLYVGGGYGDQLRDDYIVMEYDTGSGKWSRLPSYRTCDFAMAVISNQLVLVGGRESDGSSKVLGVLGIDNQGWSQPYPEMPTARSYTSVIAYNEWLVVAGGWTGEKHPSSCVEVLNTDAKQWYTGLPTPIPWNSMKSAVVGDKAYFMGGYNSSESATMTVYHVDIPALLSYIMSTDISEPTNKQIWMEIPGLQLICSTPLSVSGHLLAIGGMDKYRKAVNAIHCYHPDSGEWVKVGKLPSPRYSCTCAMTTERAVLVAGGEDENRKLKRVEAALLSPIP